MVSDVDYYKELLKGVDVELVYALQFGKGFTKSVYTYYKETMETEYEFGPDLVSKFDVDSLYVTQTTDS